MNKELIIRSSSDAVDFALLKDGKLIELHKEEETSNFQVGDIFIAKIRKPVARTECCFCKRRLSKKMPFYIITI